MEYNIAYKSYIVSKLSKYIIYFAAFIISVQFIRIILSKLLKSVHFFN